MNEIKMKGKMKKAIQSFCRINPVLFWVSVEETTNLIKSANTLGLDPHDFNQVVYQDCIDTLHRDANPANRIFNPTPEESTKQVEKDIGLFACIWACYCFNTNTPIKGLY